MADHSLVIEGGPELESPLVRRCIEAATQSADAVETWRRQRRTLERLPSQLAEALLHRLLSRRLLYPSLLEVFKYNVEKVDLRGESSVDAEWMAYLGAFHFLYSLNLSDCYRINSSALWSLSGMSYLKEVDLSRCSKVNDAGIKHLISIRTIETLCISETSVTTNGVTLLSSLKKLSKLDLGGLFITDTALISLQVLTNLQHLDLWGSDITNEGANILVKFPNLNFLNLAWTKVTILPNIPSITYLNMSNCTIHSIFKQDPNNNNNKPLLKKLILSGTSFKNVTNALSYFDPIHLSFLDLSNSSLRDLSFLPQMQTLEYLDLSGNLIGDDSIEFIASVGANLETLNLSNTRVTSSGLGILPGNVPKLEKISLSSTRIDDLAISYISLIPSLKEININATYVTGVDSSLEALENLKYLKKLNLEETPLKDEGVGPVSKLKELTHLSLRSNFLTDVSLHNLSCLPKLESLGIRDAVLTNAGIDGFTPPLSLKVLDLTGCWLLTKDVVVLFCERYRGIEIRHDFEDVKHSSLLQMNVRRRFSSSPLKPEIAAIIDERLKYSRSELLSMQFASTSIVLHSDSDMSPE